MWQDTGLDVATSLCSTSQLHGLGIRWSHAHSVRKNDNIISHNISSLNFIPSHEIPIPPKKAEPSWSIPIPGSRFKTTCLLSSLWTHWGETCPFQREVSGKKINQINPEDNSQQVLVCCSSTRTVGYKVKSGGLKQMAEDGFHTAWGSCEIPCYSMLWVLKVHMVQKWEGKLRGKMFPESYQVQPHHDWLSKSLSSRPLGPRRALQKASYMLAYLLLYALLALTGPRG